MCGYSVYSIYNRQETGRNKETNESRAKVTRWCVCVLSLRLRRQTRWFEGKARSVHTLTIGNVVAVFIVYFLCFYRKKRTIRPRSREEAGGGLIGWLGSLLQKSTTRAIYQKAVFHYILIEWF